MYLRAGVKYTQKEWMRIYSSAFEPQGSETHMLPLPSWKIHALGPVLKVSFASYSAKIHNS